MLAQFLIAQGTQGQSHPLELGFKGGLAVDNVLVPLLFFEPLLDFGASLVALADVQPVPAGTLGGFGGDDLHNVAVAQRGIDVGDAVVDLCANHGVAHTGVNGIGKINGGGAGGQGDNSALGGKDEHLVVEHIDFQGLNIFLGIGILLAFQQPPHPFKVLFAAGAGALLVFPVGSDAVFCRLVHIPGTNLNLKGDALRSDNGGVQRLIHIGLGGGNIVLEPPGHQIEQVVDMPKHIVAVGNGVDDDPERIDVVQLIHGLVLSHHLPVDGINVLDAPVGGVLNAHGVEPVGNLELDGLHKGLILLPVGIQIAGDLRVFLGR